MPGIGGFARWTKGRHIYALTVWGLTRDGSGLWSIDTTAGGGTSTLPPNNANGNSMKGHINGIQIEDNRSNEMINGIDRTIANYENQYFDSSLVLYEVLSNRAPSSGGIAAWNPIIPGMLENYDAVKVLMQRGVRNPSNGSLPFGEAYIYYGIIGSGTDEMMSMGKNIAMLRLQPIDLGDDSNGNPISPLQYGTIGSI